ncbi:related to tpa inducible protein [Phialocephala subalpina]|uniref:Related to tpa inducible protein n=1 Tax=Phialocephala subalpina TaxID=576137 RepID=A0A1L7XIR8_9HELO|nr:related to tpa inducible protein [Phialocephala subalpina]
MSSTPSSFAQNGGRQHVFQVQPNLPNPSPSQQQQRAFPRPTQGGIRPPGQQPQQQHKSPYATPYTPNNGQAGPPRQNGNAGVSAEQQIAQGILSNPAGSGTNTPQRRGPPPLGTTIHMPPGVASQSQSMSVNHAMNPAASVNQGQRQSQTSSPAMQNQNITRQSLSSTPVNNNNNLGARPQGQDGSPSDTQDLSMIDPQLAIDQQLSEHQNLGGMRGVLIPQKAPAESEIPQGEMLSPPPGGSFPTFEALFSYAQNYALQHGYAFVIGRSKRDNRGLKKVFLICDRGGTNKEKVPGEQRQRKTKSRKCGCEFGVFGLENKTAWLLRGRIDGEHLTHNHPPSESPTEHPGARKLDPKAIAAVKALEENGVSVKETLEILHRENPTVRYLPRDIYNARAAIKRDPSRVEATAMEQLPTFYKKPPMTYEEKLRADLRTELANAQKELSEVKEKHQKEVEELKEVIRTKDRQIEKFEMFIDICNERVMVQRERLAEGETNGGSSSG